MDLQIGQIVISKAGRDKGMTFVVTALDGEYAYLVDGRIRRLANPKRKKRKHIQHKNVVVELPQNDAGFRKMLEEG